MAVGGVVTTIDNSGRSKVIKLASFVLRLLRARSDIIFFSLLITFLALR